MKTYFIILLFAGFILNAEAQVDLGKFPIDSKTEKSIKTEDLLKMINWEELQEYCKKNEGHHAYIDTGSLITKYRYVKQGYVAFFEIVSFNGFVLEYRSENTDSDRPSKVSFFDKQIWLQYVYKFLPDLADSFKISIDEPVDVLRNYYRLIGVNTRDEYGWICEYSTVGMAPGRREAVIKLIKYARNDLLKKLLEYPNTQTQLYAADALIYMDYKYKLKIKEVKKMNDPNEKEMLDYVQKYLLKENDWEKIYKLRDSNKIAFICGNSGSYKIYKSNTAKILSDEAIKKVPEQYKSLEESGYFQ